MMQVQVKNVESVFSRLRKAAEDNFDAQFHDEVQACFKTVVETTPQWSGDMASNWEISLDGNALYLPWENKAAGRSVAFSPLQMGDPAAVDYALEQAQSVTYTFKDTIYFANATPLTFGDSTVTGFGITVPVRPENLIDGRVAMISYLLSTYKK